MCGCSVTGQQDRSENRLAPIICQFCHQKLPSQVNGCAVCALPIKQNESGKLLENNKDLICGECIKQSPPFDKTVAAFHYEPPISDFITQYKFNAQLELLPLLSDYLAKNIQSHYQNKAMPKLLIPVPLHKHKLVKRGFNQSQLIAKRLSKGFGIPVSGNHIQRSKETRPQMELDSNERQQNLKDAFQISQQLPSHIAIIDDVVTTGTTVTELAKQAKSHGATTIDIWCLARAFEF